MQLRFVRIALFALACAFCAAGQDSPSNIAGAGLSWSPSSSPGIAGTGLYARRIGETRTYAFTIVDALPVAGQRGSVTTQYATGIAVRLLQMGKVSLLVPTAAGVSYSGSNTGWAWSTGGMAVAPVGKAWRLMPNVRVVKSSVSDGAGYQVIAGVLVGWGW